MRNGAIGLILAILAAASLSAGYLAGNTSRATETLTSTLTSVTTSTLTTQQTTSMSSSSSSTESSQSVGGTITQFHVPWDGATYFLGESNFTSGGPTLTSNLTDVVVFDCAREAATSQGCTREVNASIYSEYQVTIWYPFSGSQVPGFPTWANCAFSSPTDGTDVPAYCISLGVNGFVVAVEAPGPG